ncbi:MAG: hypothetical protein LUE14_04325 [Clostridiales bacterium]|nr:hypothetical protein [Clostridiales bacterium]
MQAKKNIAQGELVRENILKYILNYFSEYGYAPSVREIREAVEKNSTSTIHAHMQTMHDAGILKTDAKFGSPRAFRVSGYGFILDAEADRPRTENKNHKAILETATKYILQHGYSPTYREIAEIAGFKSLQSVSQNLSEMYGEMLLENDGFLTPRTIRVPGLVFCRLGES